MGPSARPRQLGNKTIPAYICGGLRRGQTPPSLSVSPHQNLYSVAFVGVCAPLTPQQLIKFVVQGCTMLVGTFFALTIKKIYILQLTFNQLPDDNDENIY